MESTSTGMASEKDEAVVSAAQNLYARPSEGGRVLLVVRLRTAYACSAFWYFPPVTNPSTEPPRYVVVYAAAVGSLLSTGLHAARDALLTTPKTLDPPAAEPLELGGALVAAVEVGVLAKELLRPSPRHFYVLNGEAGEIVFSAPEGDDLRATLVDPALAIASSKAFASKLVGTATGLVHKLRGLSVPRMARKAARKGPKVEPSAAQLLKVLPRADILAHCELCQSWFKLATNSRSSTSDHLQELREGVAVALEPDVHASPIGPVLDQWLAAAAGAASAATETKSTAAAEEVERTAKSRAAVAGWLLALRDADLHTFAAGHPAAQAVNAASNVGSINQEPSVRLQSLLQTLDPHSRLPPHQIVFAVQSGSAMYNLATTASDEDYLLVFAASPGELLGFEPPADQIEFKGEMIGFGEDKGGIVEGSAMELGRYVSLLCKGNPMVLEPLFVASDSAVHSSSVWHELQAMRRRCLFTRRAARQYLGFVEDRLRKAQKALEVEDEIKAASKYLYHGMHKLMQLRSILAGDEPRIYLSSDGDSESDHGRIMRVRQCVRVDLAGAEALQTARAEQLLRTELQAATEELAQLKEGSFDASVESFPEEIDFEALGEWLLSIRAIIYRHQIANSANAVDDNGEILSRQSSLPSIAPALLPRQISSGSDHISADDSGEDNDSNHDKDDGQYVCSVLSQFQREERVRLVYAAERSSHSYGWAHSDSDHDIFAIFVCDRREYFGLTSLRRAASREYPEANGQCAVGVYAWELKHACKLALASNPTMLDGLRSPCVYVDLLQSETSSDSPADTWGQRMLRTALVRYDQRALAQSYLAHAKKDLREQVRRAGPEGPKRKKYLNIIRVLLSAHVLLCNGSLPPFPMPTDEGDKLGAVDSPPKEACSDLPPVNLRDLLAHADDKTLNLATRKILNEWLSPTALARGLPGLPIASNDPAALELERFIEASIETLEAPIQAALAPKHWRSKGERSWVARELERREAATKDFGTLCEELLESETRFDS